MSLAVASAGASADLSATNFLIDLNLTSAQSAQIEQILSELQTGVISPVEARAQIASIVGAPASHAAAHNQSAPPQTPALAPNADPLLSYYEMPLPQESLPKGLSYNWHGAASETIWSSSQTVNATA
jgi:hypothetical protein